MDIQTAKAQAAAAQQDAIKAEELGKAAAMTAKWEQEKDKAVKLYSLSINLQPNNK